MIPLPSLTDSIAPLSAALDATPLEEKLNWMRGLGKKELVALWKLAEGREVPVSYYTRGEGEVVIHEGQNSLPAFNVFQKRFVLRDGKVQGYNHQAMAWLTGPGHFFLGNEGGATFIDYRTDVTDVPSEFPAPKSNMAGLSRFVYGGMVDKMRRVSDDCTIGSAWRADKPTGDYFMLIRRP